MFRIHLIEPFRHVLGLVHLSLNENTNLVRPTMFSLVISQSGIYHSISLILFRVNLLEIVI